MNRRLLMLVFPVVVLIAVSAVAYRYLQTDTVSSPPFSDPDTAAKLMWSAPRTGKAMDGEHELKALEMSLKENPDHAPILVRMAQVARDMGKMDDVFRHLQEAVRADPMNKDARLELGRALYEKGDIQGAIRETERLLELDPSNTDGLYNLGAIYGNMGQDDRARPYWQKAVSVSADSDGGRRSRDALKQIEKP